MSTSTLLATVVNGISVQLQCTPSGNAAETLLKIDTGSATSVAVGDATVSAGSAGSASLTGQSALANGANVLSGRSTTVVNDQEIDLAVIGGANSATSTSVGGSLLVYTSSGSVTITAYLTAAYTTGFPNSCQGYYQVVPSS